MPTRERLTMTSYDARVGRGYQEVDRNGLDVLTREESLALLTTATLGRLGLTFGALPTILPVNFRLIDDEIVFRTSIGTKLDAATRNAVVAFEVDDLDAMYHTGWSVVVIGVAREVHDADALAVLDAAGIARWAPVECERVVAISTEMVTGRRIRPAHRPLGA